jgi:hypothetical protein
MLVRRKSGYFVKGISGPGQLQFENRTNIAGPCVQQQPTVLLLEDREVDPSGRGSGWCRFRIADKIMKHHTHRTGL